MASSRLTEEEVHAVCIEIAAQGERPTALTLLDKLGRGSLTTITKYLNSWNATDEAQTIKADTLPAVVKLPPELSKEGDELLKKIWHVAKRLTDAEIENQREALKQAEIANQSKVEEAFKFSEAQAMKIDRLEDILSDIKSQLLKEQDDHSKALGQLNEAEKTNVGLVKDNDRSQHEIGELKKQMAGLEEMNKAALQEKRELQKEHDAELKQKDKEIKTLDIEVAKLQDLLKLAVASQEKLTAELWDKTINLSNQVVEFEKLNVRYESANAELATTKADLKEANKSATESGKQVANLEGRLAVYKSLDTSVNSKNIMGNEG